MPRRLDALASALFLAIAGGCAGPTLRIEPLGNRGTAHAFVRPIETGDGTRLPDTATELALGPLPVEWEPPPPLLGGRVRIRIVGGGHRERVAMVCIMRSGDTLVRLALPGP